MGGDGNGDEENGVEHGLLVRDAVKRPLGDVARLAHALDDAVSEGFLFEAFFLFLEASGSLMKIHSRPREVHLEQGYWRLHLTLDSAQA